MLFGTKARNVFGRNSNPYQLAMRTPLVKALDHGWYPVTSGVLPPAGITKWVAWTGGHVGTIGTLRQLGVKNGTPVTITKIVQGGPTGILVRIANAAASTMTTNPQALVAKLPTQRVGFGEEFWLHAVPPTDWWLPAGYDPETGYTYASVADVKVHCDSIIGCDEYNAEPFNLSPHVTPIQAKQYRYKDGKEYLCNWDYGGENPVVTSCSLVGSDDGGGAWHRQGGTGEYVFEVPSEESRRPSSTRGIDLASYSFGSAQPVSAARVPAVPAARLALRQIPRQRMSYAPRKPAPKRRRWRI